MPPHLQAEHDNRPDAEDFDGHPSPGLHRQGEHTVPDEDNSHDIPPVSRGLSEGRVLIDRRQKCNHMWSTGDEDCGDHMR